MNDAQRFQVALRVIASFLRDLDGTQAQILQLREIASRLEIDEKVLLDLISLDYAALEQYKP